MAYNEKQVTMEPIQSNRKNAIATIYTVLAILTWCLGGVLTVFSALAYAGVGTFNEMFGEAYIDAFTLELVIGIGVGVIAAGFTFLTIAEVLKLLQKNASTVYAIRGLDQVAGGQLDPETLHSLLEAVGGGTTNDNGDSVVYDRAGGPDAGISVPMGGGAMQITVNVNAPGAGTQESKPVVKTEPAQPRIETAPAQTGSEPTVQTPVEAGTPDVADAAAEA